MEQFIIIMLILYIYAAGYKFRKHVIKFLETQIRFNTKIKDITDSLRDVANSHNLTHIEVRELLEALTEKLGEVDEKPKNWSDR